MVFVRHATNFHFVLSVLAAFASIAVAYLWRPFGVLVLLAAFGYVVWAVRVSDTKGFVRSGQMRRAFEPERHFNGLQTLVLMLVMMAQVFVAVYSFFL